MADEDKAKRRPPANEIVPQKKVEVWDTKITTIEAAVSSLKYNFESISSKLDTLRFLVIGFGVVTTGLEIANLIW